ncbi:MAG TPA: glycosyltransferase family 39 protein, partial [Candidatus Udaeobacter sp.]|nr:glycosyltransferase family 39 protein [Candidatus Udaeobacter sp.]
MFVFKPWHKAIWISVFGGVAALVLAWFAWQDPAINFLPRDRRAEWIVFPTAVDARAHWFNSLDATFRREFVSTDQPGIARLSVRAMRRTEMKINGEPVHFPPNSNWKKMVTADVAAQLHAGTNVIEARVFNHNGPPALWLTLTADQLNLRTDENWQSSFTGSSWRQAALATTPKAPGPGNSIAGGERTLVAVKKICLLWIVFAVVGGAVVFVWHAALKQPTSIWQTVALLIFASLWLLLFWNNDRLFPFHKGFDSKAHLDYITYIQQHRSLPLPTEGWEMYQPPLYYLIAAASLSLFHLSVDDQISIYVLRCLGAFFGIAGFVLVFLSLRLLLPIRAAFIGLLLAAFLPMHLYMAHYATNEMLAATLTTAALYLGLRLLITDAPRTLQFVWLGLALGAAMLAKATGILLLPIVLAAIAGKLFAARSRITVALRNVGLLLAATFAVCGGYYVRIWLKFGTPLVGNWDVISGFTWWQDPGYRTAADYIRFGRSLVDPMFSGFAGVADGVYSTLWGDALSGGASSLSIVWNQHQMAAGYLLTLVPAALILVGAVTAIVQFTRKPSRELFLLVGFCAVIALGLVFMTLKIPSYAQAKAFYGLSALTPLCFFGALGWETLTQGRVRWQFVCDLLLLVWAMNSFATYWIIPSASQHLYAAKAWGLQGKMERAADEVVKAVAADPSNAAARGWHALSLSQAGHDDEAIAEAERAIKLSPDDSAAHLDLAFSVERSDPERAISEARRAIDLGPENSSAYEFLTNRLFESHRNNEASELAREWLSISPYDANPHALLASATAATGDLVTTAQQLGYVMMLRPGLEQAHAQLRRILLLLAREPEGLKRLHEIAANAPDSPRMLDEVAWLLATYPDSKSRDGSEAVRLAEHACDLTQHKIPALLDTLAAAYAEAGDFP